MIKEFSYWILPFYKSIDDVQVLIVKWACYWWFPKWHAEKDEKPVDAAKREFIEETWIKKVFIDNKKIFNDHYVFSYKKNVIDKYVWYFIGYVCDKDVQIDPKEINDYRWLSVIKARRMLTYQNGKKLLDKALDYIWS